MNLRNLYEGSNETDCSVNCDPTICPYDCYNDLYDIPPPPTTASQSQSHHLSPYIVILSTSLASFFLLVLSYFIIKRCCSRRQGSENQAAAAGGQDEDHFLDENRGPAIDHHIWYINTVGLQPSIINSISVFRYKKGGNVIEGSDCSVCLSEFQDDETLRLLPKCNHAFHTHCIDTWLRSHTNCPLCRARIVTNSNIDPADLGQEEGLTQMGNSGENEENRGGEGGGIEGGRNEFDHNNHDDDEIRDWSFIRRSVSMDFIHSSVPKSLGNRNGNGNGNGNGNENEEGASSRNQRSFSCSGRVILTRSNQNPNSVLPL